MGTGNRNPGAVPCAERGTSVSALRSWFVRFGGLFGKQQRDRELDAEIESHIAMHVEDNVRAGMSPEEARRQALLKLGGLDQTKENYRDRRGLPWLESVLQDIRFGLRMFARTPALTAILVLTLALGIAANLYIFGIVNGVLLRPLPVRAPEQIVVLAARHPGSQYLSLFSYPEFVDLQQQAGTFSDVMAYLVGTVGITADAKTQQAFISYVSGNYFSGLGIHTALGRLILPSEGEQPGDEPPMVLGYSFWQKRFGGNPAVIGKQVKVNGKAAVIVGVVPKEFYGLYAITEMDAYLPVGAANAMEGVTGDPRADRAARYFRVDARLKPGVNVPQAQSSMDVIMGRLNREYPAVDEGMTVRVYPERDARPQPFGNNVIAIITTLFLGMGVLVMLLACFNVANILLVRATGRRREMAVRSALGAGRMRLIRQMLTEGSLLAVIGSIAGVLLDLWIGPHLFDPSLMSPGSPIRLDIGFDSRVLMYAITATVFTVIVTGSWPALDASRAHGASALREGGRGDSAAQGQHRLRHLLVIAQLSGSLVLLVVAGLFVRSLRQAERVYLGFDPSNILNVSMDAHEVGYDEARGAEFYRRVLEQIQSLPGVQNAAFAYSVPMGNNNDGSAVAIEGHPTPAGQSPPFILFNCVTEDYFQAMRIALLRGRTFTRSDDASAKPVAIVNATMANRFWPNEDALGKRFTLKLVNKPAAQTVEIVGIAANGKYSFIAEDPLPYLYLPFAQNYRSVHILQIRSSVRLESLIVETQRQIRSLAADAPISVVETMSHTLQSGNGFLMFRMGASVAGAMGGIGLILAILGVYGVVSFSAAQRTREIGIRIALGARRSEILRLIFRQGLTLVGLGILAGVVTAWGATRAMSGLLLGVSPNDPLAYLGAISVLAIVALLACWIPAGRAMRVDPMVALRYE